MSLTKLAASVLPPLQVELFGSAPWEPARDLSMVRQDATGLWHAGKGKQRRRQVCPVCSGQPKPNEYCEGCSQSGHRYRGKIAIGSTQTQEPAAPAPSRSFAERMHGRDAAHA